MKKLLCLVVCLISLFKLTTVAAAEDFTYAVPLDNIGQLSFHLEAANIPNDFTLDMANQRFTSGGNAFFFKAEQVPTETIRVFSANHVDGIRQIYVNTQFTITSQTGTYPSLVGQKLYLFYNKYGGVSLTTPNFAGNVPDDQRDVMLEYVVTGTQLTPDLTTVSPDNAPYRISTSELGTLNYFKEFTNAPSLYQFDFNNNQMYAGFRNWMNTAHYGFKVFDGPTKEIRVFNADGSGVRTVKVNTRVVPTTMISGTEYGFGQTYYLFKNYGGSISLVTPNFAGNVANPNDLDIMLEYVPNN